MNAAILGCGAIAPRWLRVLAADPRVDITVLVDPDRHAARTLATRHRLQVPWTASLEQALAGHDVEVVVNLSPPERHAGISRAALGAGCHVLSEKPLATSLTDATGLVDLARRRGRVLAVMHNRGSDPRFAAFTDLVTSRDSGPYAVTAEVLVALPQAGFRATQPLPVTVDLAVHAFDQIRRIITAAALTVACTETPLGFLDQHCSLGTITVWFADGSVFSYRGGYTRPGLATAANGRWRVEGSRVTAGWDGAATLTEATGRGEPRTLTCPPAQPGYQVCLAAMLQALHTVPAPVPAAGALGSIALLEAAVASATAGGARVDVSGTTKAHHAP